MACQARGREVRIIHYREGLYQAFMSPAGGERYNRVREEAGHCDQVIQVSPEQAPQTGG